MQILLFLIFLAVPVIEIALFIEAGRIIGIVPTIAITIATAIAGSFLMRVQGFATLSRFSQALEKGEMPVTPVIDGIGILCAGLLLLTPGLFTDVLGLLLFVPPIRRGIAKWLFAKAIKSGNVHFRAYRQGQGPKAQSRQPPPRSSDFKRSSNVVDAEFETVEPGESENGQSDTKADGDKDSPWKQK
jgi:UPF0716 protein FxsA